MEPRASDAGRAHAKRAVKTYLLAVGLTFLFYFVSLFLPSNIALYMSFFVVVGLLLGPYASLGANTVSLVMNLLIGVPLDLCLLDLVTTFLVSYLPYRMWYGTLTGSEPEPPSMTGVRAVAKLFLVMIVSAVVYTILYHYSYSLLYGGRMQDLTNLANLLSVLAFSLVLGMALTIVFRSRGIRLYVPHSRFAHEDARRRAAPLFDVALAAVLVLGALVLLDVVDGGYWPMAVIYALIAVYLLKPLANAEDDDSFRSGRHGFDDSIIERIILIFVIIGLAFSILFGVAAYRGVLEDLLGVGRELSAIFYVSASCLAFFAVALLFLWYIERRIAAPISEISAAARGFVDEEEGMSGAETKGSYSRYLGHRSEIGVLARSLTEMTDDIEAYVEDIRTLTVARERLLAELSLARSIQESLVPRDFGSVAGMGVDVCGEMRAAKFVGGDLYDFFPVDDRHLAVAVADVSGKGMPAALLMAVTRSLLRSHTVPGAHPSEVLAKVNRSICDNNDQDMFVTCWLGVLDTATGEMEFANAGHCWPVLSRAGSEPELERTRPGMVLGGRYRSKYADESLALGPGDRLVLYSDGVTEANGDFQGFYGEDRLMSMAGRLSGCTVEEEVRAIVDDVLAHTGESDQYDDITLFVLGFRGDRQPSDRDPSGSSPLKITL